MGTTAPLTSCGGGAGANRHVSGYFPFAALRSAKTQSPRVSTVSYGSGAGAYKHVSGDYPIAALCGARKKFNSVQILNKTTDFVLIHVRPISSNDIRTASVSGAALDLDRLDGSTQGGSSVGFLNARTTSKWYGTTLTDCLLITKNQTELVTTRRAPFFYVVDESQG